MKLDHPAVLVWRQAEGPRARASLGGHVCISLGARLARSIGTVDIARPEQGQGLFLFVLEQKW